MRVLSFAALIAGVLLIPSALGVAKVDHDRRTAQTQRTLVSLAQQHGNALESYFARARAITLLTANTPSYADVVAAPGTRREKVRRNGRALRDVTHSLGYLERLYPGSIGEACFIDADGEEFARVVRGQVAPAKDLSTLEEHSVFFRPTFALAAGQVYQARPYVSPDTHEWVVSNSTLIPQPDGRKRAIAHFEVTVESFRQAMGHTPGSDLRVIDAGTGRVIIDGERPQAMAALLGDPDDHAYTGLAAKASRRSGVTEVHGRSVAYRRITPLTGNANDWIVVAAARTPTGSFVWDAGPATIGMLALAILIVTFAGISLRAGRRELETQATTDVLTGLGNRRKLMTDLERAVRDADSDRPLALVLFDLNGFKNYNDTFGHLAGDALLERLGLALTKAVVPLDGRAYRPGGDEFCVLAPGARREEIEVAASAALSEHGEGFEVTTAFGSVVVPEDTSEASDALRRADEAMYAQKNSGRQTASRQSSDVLMRAMAERHPDLGEHVDGVAELVGQVGQRMGIGGEELVQLRHAAVLHDIGKVAIPDAIIYKPGPLDDAEWAFIRRHTVIGERILAAAPSLSGAAKLVRASHESWDGSGYPDQLAGADIPLGARIIAVCDAFDAMISARSYATAKTTPEALAELRRCAGQQFDPAIVDVFLAVMLDRARPPVATA
ncbi:MAG: hypothetical protein QOI80_2997 [Solirubrobacteraceae bacterium]|jgi:diguanylate cyclase (GGDEF)-like protein|nr:hypothetical protein [Solirubrobacteraceae bacterium]